MSGPGPVTGWIPNPDWGLGRPDMMDMEGDMEDVVFRWLDGKFSRKLGSARPRLVFILSRGLDLNSPAKGVGAI